MDYIIKLKPLSILDIGIGCGKYGFLCREYLDFLYCDKEHFGDRRVMIDGIEAFEPYITDVQRRIYDDIYIGDALNVVSDLTKKYNLVLAIDVIEHFDKEQATSLLSRLKSMSNYIIISVPREFCGQEASFGNNYEIHKSSFTKKELHSLGFKKFKFVDSSMIAIYGCGVENIDASIFQRLYQYIYYLTSGLRSFVKKIIAAYITANHLDHRLYQSLLLKPVI
jgi:hypothetical protein